MTKEEAIEVLKKHHMWTGEPQEVADVRVQNEALHMAIEALEEKHDNWIEEEADLYPNSLYTAYCPKCRHYVNWFEEGYGGAIIRELPNYCSYCGTKLKKKED